VNYKDLSIVDREWKSYEGNFLEGKKDGYGTLDYADGSKYVGVFKNGVPNGLGSFTSN